MTTPADSPTRMWWRRLWALRPWAPPAPDQSIRATIEELIEEEGGKGSSDIDPDERFLLMNALKLKDRNVDDVMVPRADIRGVPLASGFQDLIRLFVETNHSRLPVYKKTLDHIVGMVHIKDVMAHCLDPSHFRLDQHMREMLFVSPHMQILDLLHKMRATHTHMAVVVDEFGGADGLITIEDVVEEIVGEIYDEHESPTSSQYVHGADGSILVDARLPLEEMEKYFLIPPLDEPHIDQVETIGGWLTAKAGGLLQKGDIFEDAESGLFFRIIDADARRVKRLQIQGLIAKPGAGINALIHGELAK